MLTHHVRDEHEWEGGECDFHPLIVCSCGQCNKKKKITCEGKKYKSSLVLNCPYHTLAYFVELHNRSKQAEKVIDKELGRGHTNQLESANSALIRFRKKCWNLQRIHYITATNLGLLESNLTFMHSLRGIEYHWLLELYEKLGVPDFDGVRAYYKEKNKKREGRRLERQTTNYKKKAYAAKHKHRVIEQGVRKEVSKRERIDHTYKTDMGFEDEPEVTEHAKKCVCGATDHVRRNHKNCPLNPLNAPSTSRQSLTSQLAEASEGESDFEGFDLDDGEFSSSGEFYSDGVSSSDEEAAEICSCKGKAHKRDCPLNPRKKTVAREERNAKKQLGVAVSRKGKGKAVTRRALSAEKTGRPPLRQPFQRRNKRKLVYPPSPVSKRACVAPLRVFQGSECVITLVEPCQDVVMNPPDRVWKEGTMKYIEQWAGTSLEYKEDTTVIKAEIDSISPHQVDSIEGDGHCFFRAISKAVTGTQDFHSDFRKAVVAWMLLEDHPQQLAQYIAPFDPDTDTDGKTAIRRYIDESYMSRDGWGGDKEIRAFATMFQIEICVSNNSPGGRRWNVYPPLFHNAKTCKERSDYKLYLYHSDSGSHYDLVIPSKE